MYSFKVIVFVAVVAFVQASPQYHHQATPVLNHITDALFVHPTPIVDNDTPANYNFGYSVNDPNTQDVKEQQETRIGHNVQGHYSVVEPGGSRRVVHYTADEQNGFNAVVQHEGFVVHPAPVVNTPVQVAIPVIPNAAPVVSHQQIPILAHLNGAIVPQPNFNLLSGHQ